MPPCGTSSQTRGNWLVDSGLLVSAALAALSGLYFLYLPVGGLRGGRNPWAGVQILFERHSWDDLHTWAGVAMIAVAAVHLVLHWPWVVSMTRRAWKDLRGQNGRLNARGRWNLLLDAGVGISFAPAAVSGIYFLFFPGGQGATTPTVLLTRAGWDFVHTWSGAALIAMAVVHFAIHWRWVAKVTRSMLMPARRKGSARSHARGQSGGLARVVTTVEREG